MSWIDSNESTDAVGKQPNIGEWTDEQWGDSVRKLLKENAHLKQQLVEVQDEVQLTMTEQENIDAYATITEEIAEKLQKTKAELKETEEDLTHFQVQNILFQQILKMIMDKGHDEVLRYVQQGNDERDEARKWAIKRDRRVKVLAKLLQALVDLKSLDIDVRDEASIAISDVDDPMAIPFLKHAKEIELFDVMKNNFQLVIDQLVATALQSK